MVVKELFASLGLQVDETSFKQADALFSTMEKALLGIGAAAVAAGAGLAVFVKQTANAGDDAKVAAARLGVTTDAVQELGYAAEQSDTSIESLQQAFVFLAKKGVKDVDAEFSRLAETFAGLPNDGTRAKFAFDNLGKAGKDLAPLLSEGADGLARLRAEAREMGLVLDGTAVEAADAFNDTLGRIGKRLDGLRNRVIGPWLPRFEKMLVRVEKVVSALSDALFTLSKYIDLIVILLGSTLLAAVVALAGGFEALLVTVLATGIELLVVAADAVIAWTAVLAPVAALAAAFALVAIILEDVYVWLTGGDSLIGEIGEKWTKFLDTWFQNTKGDGWLVNALKAVTASVTDLGAAVPQAIEFWVSSFKAFFSWVSDKFGVLSASLMEKLEAPLGALRRLFGDTPTPAGVPAVSPTGGGLSSFGGGASPAASATASVSRPIVSAPTFNGSFTVNAAPGQNPQEIAGAMRTEMDAWFDTKMRATAAAVGA